MSIRELTDDTRITLALAASIVAGVASISVYVGRVSERLSTVEKQQAKIDDWAGETTKILAKLEERTKDE